MWTLSAVWEPFRVFFAAHGLDLFVTGFHFGRVPKEKELRTLSPWAYAVYNGSVTGGFYQIVYVA
jgi:hypothetical protein